MKNQLSKFFEKKAFLVSSGECAEFRIDGIFSSERKALRFIKEAPKDNGEYYIEPYKLDIQLQKGKKYCCVKMSKNGKVINVDCRDDFNPLCYQDRLYFEEDYFSGEINLRFYLLAKDKDEAISLCKQRLNNQK